MRLVYAALTSALFLTACGGSESGSVSFPSATDYAPLNISDENASSLYADSTKSVAGDNTASPSLPADALAFSPSTSIKSLASITELYPTFAASNRATGTLDDNAQCQGGGSLSLSGSGDLANAGDFLSVLFNNCVSSGTTLNGGFSMTKLSSAADNNDIRIVFTRFASTNVNQSVSIHGDMTLRSSTVGTTQYAAIESTELNIRDSVLGDTAIANMAIEGELDSSGESRLDIAYTIGADNLGGRVTLTTPITMTTASGAAWPDTGQLRIDGHGTSYAVFDANTGDNSTVLVTVNDGNTTESNTVAWASLNGSEFSEFVDFN